MPHENASSPCLVFLYGSLRDGSGNPHAAILRSRCRLAGQGYMKGRLFRAGQHYAAVHDSETTDVVHGDVLEIPGDLANEILEGLDRYEGIAPGLGEPAFRRERVAVTMQDGSVLNCWTWIYIRSIRGCSPIRHGDALNKA